MNESASHREADRTEVVRGLSLRGRKARRFRPVRALTSLALFGGVLVGILYGVILIAGRSDGVRNLLETRLSRELDAPVTLGAMRITPGFHLVLEEVEIESEASKAGCRVGRVTLRLNPAASKAARRLVYDQAHMEQVRVDVMETRLGTREPEALTRPAGLYFWGKEVNPDEVPLPTVEELRGGGRAPEPYAVLPGGRWMDIHPRSMRFLLRGVDIRVHDSLGVLQCEFSGLEIGVEPEDEGVVTPARRYSVHGRYEMRGRGRGVQPLHLEIVHQDGEWHFLRVEAEQHFLQWLSDVLGGESAGPLVEGRGR